MGQNRDFNFLIDNMDKVCDAGFMGDLIEDTWAYLVNIFRKRSVAYDREIKLSDTYQNNTELVQKIIKLFDEFDKDKCQQFLKDLDYIYDSSDVEYIDFDIDGFHNWIVEEDIFSYQQLAIELIEQCDLGKIIEVVNEYGKEFQIDMN